MRRHGSLLTDDTVAVIYSDGMDVGAVSEPSARGMQAAMPYVTSFLGYGTHAISPGWRRRCITSDERSAAVNMK